MIRRRTVLILGAGASRPYNFPLGSQLVDQICEEILAGRAGLITRLENSYAKQPGDAAEFARLLAGARPFSIDAFLEAKRRFNTIGKAAIADLLLRTEHPEALQAAKLEADWYRYLLSDVLVRRNPEHFQGQVRHLSIVTFNFDRSFERALFSTLENGFEITSDKARSLATELDIHHVHGTLGEPDWLYPDRPGGNPYGVPDNGLVAAVAKAVPRMKIVSDEIPTSVIEDLQVVLQKAEFVYFIGFGFDDRNLERLGIPGILSPTAVVRGTSLGKTTMEQEPIIRCFREMKVHLYQTDDALTFVRTRAESLFD